MLKEGQARKGYEIVQVGESFIQTSEGKFLDAKFGDRREVWIWFVREWDGSSSFHQGLK